MTEKDETKGPISEPPETSVKMNSFMEIKEVASKNIGQLLADLGAFEEAIKEENIPEVYRLYNGSLPAEIKKTANENHEIDQLLAQKIHESFIAEFPFMERIEKISETMNYYKIGTYYRERPTIAIDSSIPEIFILPKIDQAWSKYRTDASNVLTNIERQMDELDAKAVSAKAEIDQLTEQINELKQQETAIANSKGFFNRGKIDEEIEGVSKKRTELEAKKAELMPYAEDRTKTAQQKNYLQVEYQKTRLERALVEKEQRQINHFFGGFEEMHQKITSFLTEYLAMEGAEANDA